jgi:hypothetical protein
LKELNCKNVQKGRDLAVSPSNHRMSKDNACNTTVGFDIGVDKISVLLSIANAIMCDSCELS